MADHRKFFVGGNWKMNGNKASIDEIIKFLNEKGLNPNTGQKIVILLSVIKRIILLITGIWYVLFIRDYLACVVKMFIAINCLREFGANLQCCRFSAHDCDHWPWAYPKVIFIADEWWWWSCKSAVERRVE